VDEDAPQQTFRFWAGHSSFQHQFGRHFKRAGNVSIRTIPDTAIHIRVQVPRLPAREHGVAGNSEIHRLKHSAKSKLPCP
jgi:hypothetical protein